MRTTVHLKRIVDEGNQIIAGHGVLAFAKELGMDAVSCICITTSSTLRTGHQASAKQITLYAS